MNSSTLFHEMTTAVRELNVAIDTHNNELYSSAYERLLILPVENLTGDQCRVILEGDISLLMPYETAYRLHRIVISDNPIVDDFRRFALWLRLFGPDTDAEADDIELQGRLEFAKNNDGSELPW